MFIREGRLLQNMDAFNNVIMMSNFIYVRLISISLGQETPLIFGCIVFLAHYIQISSNRIIKPHHD
jgi:hypothetical protein